MATIGAEAGKNGTAKKAISARAFLAAMASMTGNTSSMSRRGLWNEIDDVRRDYDEEFGYPKTSELTPAYYQKLYEREPYAARVVEVLPKESWQVQPMVYEESDPGSYTDFDNAWLTACHSLRGDSSYRDEEGNQGNPMWEYLLRADIRSGIGSYGCIMLGFDDGGELKDPVVPREGMKLQFVRVFSEQEAQVAERERNVKSPRVGQPTVYNLSLDNPSAGSLQSMNPEVSITSKPVHWTRIIHLADNLESNEINGRPRMRPVLNPLLDIRKVRGASGEMYYVGALPGLSIETHPDLAGEVEVDEDAMRDMIESYLHGMQRFIALRGQSAKSLAPQVVDPTGQIRVQIEAICILLGIPIRIFMGSERGELASSQDDSAWNDRLIARQRGYITPRMVVPLVDRLIWVGVLPKPPIGFKVRWPDLTSQSGQEKATQAATITQAIVAYASGGASSLITPIDFLTRVLPFSDEDARAMLENTIRDSQGPAPAGGETPSPLLGLVGGITAMIELFKLAKDGGLTEEQLKQQIILFFKVTPEQADALIAEGLAPAPAPGLVPTPGLPSAPGSPAFTGPTPLPTGPVLVGV